MGKNGQLWTNPLSWTLPRAVAVEYNRRLAELVGGQVSTDSELYLTTNGKSAPKLSALLPEHAEGWAAAIEWAIKQLRSLDSPDAV